MKDTLPIEVPDTHAILVCTKNERHEVAHPPTHKPMTTCPVYHLGSPCRGTLKRVGKGSRPGAKSAAA